MGACVASEAKLLPYTYGDKEDGRSGARGAGS